MKLRLLDDTVRLRLTRGEVVAASEQGVVEGQTRFPDGSVFTFALEALKKGPASASYVGNRMVVRLPASEISAWANDDEAVSLRGELELPAGGPLRILVEKDFKCVTPRGDEDQSDLFVNPDGAC
jgi:Family of unknown function (DUF7009)